MFILITGNIEAGKTTLLNHLKKEGYDPVIEYTTRPMRKGEVDGRDYHFVSDADFDALYEKGEFAEELFVVTVHGLWKYGGRKKDMKDGCILACGPSQAIQIISSNVPVFSVLLDIDETTAKERMNIRGDDPDEFVRRFTVDKEKVEKLKSMVSLICDAKKPIEENAKQIKNNIPKGGKDCYAYFMEDRTVITSQPMDPFERDLYLIGQNGLRPYLRMKENGMPKDPIHQIAWLLLNGSGCGFCKVCRDKPCNIKEKELCTANIANYIRECVHKEDETRKKK